MDGRTTHSRSTIPRNVAQRSLQKSQKRRAFSPEICDRAPRGLVVAIQEASARGRREVARRTNSASPQMLRQKRQTELAGATVRAVEDFLPRIAGDAEDFVHLLHALETLTGGGDGKNIVTLARFHEQGTRRDEPGDEIGRAD